MDRKLFRINKGGMGYDILFLAVVIILLMGGVYFIEKGERRADASFSVVDALWQDCMGDEQMDGQKVVSQCVFGMKTQKVEKLLRKSGVQYTWSRTTGNPSDNPPGNPPASESRYVDIERGRYRLFFDQNGKMCKACIKSGSSRNRKFETGMSTGAIVEMLGEELYKESGEQPVYWSRKPISGVYYGFVFRNDKLEIIWEKE